MKACTCHVMDVKKDDGICGCELHEGDGVLWLAFAEIWAPFEIEADGAMRKVGEEVVCFVVVCKVVQGWVDGAMPPGIFWRV